jgi:uridine kinase
MKIACLITGVPRSFKENWSNFFSKLDQYLDIDFYIYFPKTESETLYTNESISSVVDNLYSIKTFLIDDNVPEVESSLSSRQKNTVYQWYRLSKIFEFVASSNRHYDAVLRMRPDLDISMSPLVFAQLLKTLNIDKMNIPYGYDIYSKDVFNKVGSFPSCNDQMAFSSYTNMQLYCQLYRTLYTFKDLPFISEMILFKYLETHRIEIYRFDCPYKLLLSNCQIIAISGDSGAGKTTLLKAIEDIFPYDSRLVVETDRYHKWERGSSHWNSYTHLHPEANHLEKMSDDIFRLKLGESVITVDYDHDNGKFISNVCLEPKPYIILCGLHTLYQKELRKNLDFKIFVDTEETLRTQWKIQRDITERGHSLDSILKSIQNRKQDSSAFIGPQKEHADMIIENKFGHGNTSVTLHLKSDYTAYVHMYLLALTVKVSYDIYPGFISYSLSNINMNDYILSTYALRDKLKLFPNIIFKESYMGIIQLVILLLLYQNE